MHTLTDERITLQVFMNAEDVKVVAGYIASSPTPEEKVKLMEEFIMKFFLLLNPVPDAVDHAANIIVDKWGQVNIDDLCKQVFISRRQFERKFLQKVGLSPKYYARLRRIGYICMKIAGKEEVDWPRIPLRPHCESAASQFVNCRESDQSERHHLQRAENTSPRESNRRSAGKV